MKHLLSMSEAFNLGLHALVKMSKDSGRKFTIKNLSNELKVSEAHLSKVMQRLAKAGILLSISGPQGGFSINREISSITILEIYEIIEGKFTQEACLLKAPVCVNGKCIMGDLIKRINHEVYDYLSNTRLIDLRS